MIHFRATGLLSALGAALLLQACSTVPTVAVPETELEVRYDSRAAELSALDSWTLEGKLAVNDGNDGGSGKLRWQEDDGHSRMDFHGALGRGAWRLVSGPGGAELELADGRSFKAASVSELVRDQLGWSVPVEALSWWVLGLQAPGSSLARTFDEDGTLKTLSQQGWDIEFERYREQEAINMPMKVTARQGEKMVKLAVRQWELSGRSD